MTKLRRTTIVAGALCLLAGIGILVSTATAPVPNAAGPLRLATALGFSIAGFGLLALTRREDRGQLVARCASATLGVIAIGGLTMVGLHAVSVRPYLPSAPLASSVVYFGSELDLLMFIGFLSAAIALFVLTLNGRKRAGASIAASLAVTIGMIGVGSLGATALGLQSNDTGLVNALLATALFPTIGVGLLCAARKELDSLSSGRTSPTLDQNLSATTGVCLGLVALCAYLVFSLTAREGEELHWLNETDRFRMELRATTASLNRLDEHLNHSSRWANSVEVSGLEREASNVEASLHRLRSFSNSPVYQRHLGSSIVRAHEELAALHEAAALHNAAATREAAQKLAVFDLSKMSADLAAAISKSEAALQHEIDANAARHVSRRRAAAIMLAGSAIAMSVLLGAIHLLFQRDAGLRQRSETALRRHNETLKGFAHTVAHDLRAPLRGITGYASELDGQAHLVDARGRHCITQINTAAQNLEKLIGDTLDYAQLDAETPSLSTIVLPTLIASLLQQRAPEIRLHGTQIDTHFGIVTVQSWERGIVQIVGNLLDNAIKYSRHSRPPRLRIESAQTPLSWQIAIYDNGIGFDMKYHDRIFGLFQRLVTPDEFEGTGAGLAIVRKITDRLGGTVRAEGRPGGGATFLVELPRIMNPELT